MEVEENSKHGYKRDTKYIETIDVGGTPQDNFKRCSMHALYKVKLQIVVPVYSSI